MYPIIGLFLLGGILANASEGPYLSLEPGTTWEYECFWASPLRIDTTRPYTYLRTFKRTIRLDTVSQYADTVSLWMTLEDSGESSRPEGRADIRERTHYKGLIDLSTGVIHVLSVDKPYPEELNWLWLYAFNETTDPRRSLHRQSPQSGAVEEYLLSKADTQFYCERFQYEIPSPNSSEGCWGRRVFQWGVGLVLLERETITWPGTTDTTRINLVRFNGRPIPTDLLQRAESDFHRVVGLSRKPRGPRAGTGKGPIDRFRFRDRLTNVLGRIVSALPDNLRIPAR
jgi:hypothetical protein